MTPKQILDSFSETLMQDERILSAQERTLLRNLIQHTRSAPLEPDTHAAVNATIGAAVGETVAQRAFAVLGGSIVDRILAGAGKSNSTGTQDVSALGAPQPPSPRPPQPPSPPSPTPDDMPIVPPGPPGIAIKRPLSAAAVLERPLIAQAQCVVLDEFLAPQEVQDLMRFALEHEADFCPSGILAPGSMEPRVNENQRRSLVLMDLGKYHDLVLARIQSALPLVLSRLDMDEFPVSNVEAQITASSDGDFFRCHNDNGDPQVASRQLTFVYFFHREPRQFSGGELRIHDCRLEGNRHVRNGSFRTIVPQQNQIVFFPCSVQHEITPVECPSKIFADGRFTLNGWLHK